LGLPKVEELKRMSKQIDQAKIELIQSIDDIPKRSFKEMFSNLGYNDKDVELAADLVNKMLLWVPKDRISCVDAL
jgi:hypothetical protein